MTDKERELALYCLKASSDYHSEVCEECINYPNCDHTIQDDVTETIIQALEQEPCDKYIKEIDHLRKYISKLETRIVEQEQKTGHWIDEAEKELWYRCSECRERVWGGHHKYCPNCGAKMVETREREG